MGDGFYTPCSQCGGNDTVLGFCINCYDIRVLDRSKEHVNANIFKAGKQNKRDNYNDYLKKVVK